MFKWLAKSTRGTDASATLGNTEAVCPFCNHRLAKKPGRKTKCPNCANFIYVRTRPSDNQKVLVTEEQKEVIEEQWSIVNGTHDLYLAERRAREQKKVQLSKRTGREPSKNEVEWSLLQEQLKIHAKNGDWGLYASSRFQMAEILRKESKLKDALALYLEVCYLDLNGPRNTGSGGVSGPRIPAPAEHDPLIRKMFPPFSPDEGLIAPGVVVRMSNIVQDLGIGPGETKQMFDPVARLLKTSLQLPMNPNAAWLQIEAELFGDASE